MSSYCWSFYEDEWFSSKNEESVESCIEEARRCANDNSVVYVAKVERYIPNLDGESIKTILFSDSYPAYEDVAEDWLSEIDDEELEKYLTNALCVWLKSKNLMPKFGELKDFKCYDLKTGKLVESEE
jgi:hypothetical protein